MISMHTRALVATICLASAGISTAPKDAQPAETHPLKIGIIGAGRIGGTLAMLWAKAGHEALVLSRHPDQLKDLVRSLGPKARAGTPREAAVFGDVVLISVPYGALPQIGPLQRWPGAPPFKQRADTCKVVQQRPSRVVNSLG